MKIIHIPFCFHPDSLGGTEVYVESLAYHLQQRGVLVTIAVPGDKSSFDKHNGLAVRRFAVSNKVADLRDLYGQGDATAAQEFAKILDEEQPDIVHLHAFTRGASLRLVREAKQRGSKIVFTYHTPTVSCQRGTLLRWGKEVCDGKLDLHTCAGCTLQALGLSGLNAVALGHLPPLFGRLAGAAGLSGGSWTALRMTELVQLRHSAFHDLMQAADQIVTLCQWVKDLLTRNGIPTEKLSVSRHGLPQRAETGAVESVPIMATPLRLAFLGRLDQTKGPDLLIRALRSLPGAAIELHLYGIVQAEGGKAYIHQLNQLAEGDPRIHFFSPVPSDRVITLLRNYHLLAVPSRCLETGPLVVLEAFAAGTPVVGADLGGIAEWVKHDVNGLLVAADSIEAWSQTLKQCNEDRTLVARLRQGVRLPRGMDVVAQEMLLLYERTLRMSTVHQAPSDLIRKPYARG
jgi:glycosyltransferase involved in cell wall biosynthesis